MCNDGDYSRNSRSTGGLSELSYVALEEYLRSRVGGRGGGERECRRRGSRSKLWVIVEKEESGVLS